MLFSLPLLRLVFLRRSISRLLGLGVLLLGAVTASALIGPAFQLQLGNPTGATADTNDLNHYLIQRPIEALDYNNSRGQANWASWDLTSGDANGAVARQDSFGADTNLPPNFYPVADTEYSGSGFDRGHLCPSADRTDSTNDNDLTFLMSNMMPQAPDNNRGVWANFEGYCRTLADAGNEVLIMCGPSGFDGSHISSSAHVLIASNTWKIAVIVPLGGGTALDRITTTTNRVIAIRVPNTNGVSSTWQNYLTTAHSIELETGFTFFTALPGPIASAFRSRMDGLTNPPAPSITSFTPTSGLASSNIVIFGTNFNSASVVRFNGSNAIFVVDANTQITTTVPANATTGPISVTTPGGTATSIANFTVTAAAPAPDLALALTHSGNFTQGDSNQTYTLVVSNPGTAASIGPVTVTNFLPAGLTATALSGAGWTTTLATLTATRSDALAASASFPPLTLTVNVASNAPASVTNSATISGGADANVANNSAFDLTTINPLVVIPNGPVVLVGWDLSALPGGANNYGPSPLAPTTNATNLTIVGLTRGAGVATVNTGAARGWGGNNFVDASAANAINSNRFATFAVMANAGYQVSYSAVSRFDYRRSATGPPNGLLQYQIGAGAFTDIATVAYSSATNLGASLSPIDLSGIPALQQVGAGTNVTFRLVNWGGTSSVGTWYLFDTTNNNAPDFVVQGALAAATLPHTALPPVISLLTITNQQFHLTVSGSPGTNYLVEATTNLTTPVWLPVATNAAPFQFIDSASELVPQRFYRASVAQ